VSFFLEHVAPNFIRLHILNVQVGNLRFHEPLAAVTSQDKQPQDRVTVDASHALGTANTHPFQEQPQHALSLIQRQAHIVQRALVIFCVGFLALIAAEALKAVSMLSETLAGGTAVVAGHGFSLALSGETRHNYNWVWGVGHSALWICPATC